MYNELEVRIGTKTCKAFFKSKKEEFFNKISPIHNHHYTEIHLLARGEISFDVDNKRYNLTPGNILAVPQEMYHICLNTSLENTHICFFIDVSIKSPKLIEVPSNLIEGFIEDYKKAFDNGNYCKIASYVSLLCNDIFGDEVVYVKASDDYAIVIEEFFSIHYAEDVRLFDLASQLCLSEKQTERLVLKHTGKTFKQKLSCTRVEMAKKLIEDSNMPMQKAAEYVGYKSYSGFWKALKEYK